MKTCDRCGRQARVFAPIYIRTVPDPLPDEPEHTLPELATACLSCVELVCTYRVLGFPPIFRPMIVPKMDVYLVYTGIYENRDVEQIHTSLESAQAAYPGEWTEFHPGFWSRKREHAWNEEECTQIRRCEVLP